MSRFQFLYSEYGCTAYTSSSSTPVFPYFQVTEGYYAKADVILDYTYWQLNTNATIATSCTTTGTNFGQGRIGLLGLGRNGTQANFLVNSSLFSVYLDPYYGKSTLLFESNTNITSISTFVGSLSTNADWNVLPTSVQISCLNYSVTENLGAIFDINANGIGFPLTIFQAILQTLEGTGTLNCENGTTTPECYYYPKSGFSLPTIKLFIQAQDQEIDLPPDLYISGDLDGTGTASVTLNLKAVDPSLSGASLVTSAYQNYIIFDKNFLAYYYTEYTAGKEGGYTVTLYKPNFETPGPVVWPWIVGGVFGFIVIVGVILFIIKRRRNKRIRDQLNKKSEKDAVNRSSQGLIANAKASDVGDVQSYLKRDYTRYQYGKESWISPDVPQST